MSLRLSEKIQLGALFTSFADFNEALKDWCSEAGYSFRIASSETMKGQRDEKERFRYRYVVYNCIHYGEPRIRGTGIRPHQSYLSTGCAACLRLTYQPEVRCLKIIRIHAEHSGHGKASEEMPKRIRDKVEGSDEPQQIETPPPPVVSNVRTRAVAAAETPKTARQVTRSGITGKSQVEYGSADQTLSSRKHRTGAIDYFDPALEIEKIHKKQRKLVKRLERKTADMDSVVNKRREKDGRSAFNPPPLTSETLPFFSKLDKKMTMTVEQEAEMKRLTVGMIAKKLGQKQENSPPVSDCRNIEDEEEWIVLPE